jgi:tetratricopeptide (TPR) repeat protein
LKERYPDTDFEVICMAMTAINSHAILPIARECARLEGDLWVIYMGNNEMVGPFGAGTIFGAKAPGLGFVRTSLALKTTRLGQLMAGFISKLGSKSQIPARWGGINMFKKNLLRHDDPKKLRAYKNFEGNLKDIVEVGRKAGIPIILSTVGSNLKDCSPFASLHREGLETSSKSEWDLLFQEGMALEKKGQHAEALSLYTEAAVIDSEYAELQFRLGTCQLALGHSEQARQGFERARDYDALAVRADTRINRILTDSTLGGDGRLLRIDAAETLSTQSPESISGQELFYEHVHLTTQGNFTLARIIADQVTVSPPPEVVESQAENWLENEACNRQLALTQWDQMRLWQEQSERINTMPFISQTSNPHNKTYISAQQKRIKARITNNTWTQDHQLYVAALDRAPEDPYLIGNYAQFLDATGKSAEAIEQAEKFCALLPDVAWTHYYLAALLAKTGQLEEARGHLETAVKLNSDFPQAQEMLKQIN